MKARKPLLYLSCLGLSGSAHALPIFSESARIVTSNNVVLYPDDTDPNLAYYIPGDAIVPKTSSGSPSFGFTYMGLRKDPTTGEITAKESALGFMMMTVRATPTAEQREEIAKRIASGQKIAVLPVMRSTVTIGTSTAKTPLTNFFTEFNFSEKSGQFDADIDLMGTLNPTGALIMASQLKSPAFMKVDFCYKAQGVGPVFKAEVDLNWKEVHETLKASFKAGSFFKRYEVSETIYKLKREGKLKVTLRRAPGDSASEKEWIMKIADRMLERMFKVEVPSGATTEEKWAFARVSLDHNRSEVSESIQIHFDESNLVELEGCQTLGATDLNKHFDEVVHSADGIDVFKEAR